MIRFADLFAALDQTTSTNARVAALAHYFRTAPEPDRLWTIALLSGRRPKRSVTATQLRQWTAEAAGIPLWLFEEAYPVVGDLAETIALVLPPAPAHSQDSLATWVARLQALATAAEPAKRSAILSAWAGLGTTERFLFNKLITGGFRMGVSQTLMTRALAEATGLGEADLAQRLMGDWTPDTTSYSRLILTNDPDATSARPYPFYLAYGLDTPPENLGDPAGWFAEWKWDGIRGQLVLRGGTHHLWSRGEELVTARFPELAGVPDFLPDGTVIDGEILAWRDAAPLPFALLQKRIGLKTAGKKVLADAPVILMAYDLLEGDGTDLRTRPFAERRTKLAALLAALPASLPLRLSPEVDFADWADLATRRATARQSGAEGLMLKRRAAPYLAGRKRGDWWKWKLDPMTVDAVMIYAQAGHGRRAALYTDFTFAVWDGPSLVPFAKAYSGLTDAEFVEITAWVKQNTGDRFGPVRQVTPDLVFELAFEGIQPSPRHKSGVALRFPRMLRWRRDKPAAEANTLADLHALLASGG